MAPLGTFSADTLDAWLQDSPWDAIEVAVNRMGYPELNRMLRDAGMRGLVVQHVAPTRAMVLELVQDVREAGGIQHWEEQTQARRRTEAAQLAVEHLGLLITDLLSPEVSGAQASSACSPLHTLLTPVFCILSGAA